MDIVNNSCFVLHRRKIVAALIVSLLMVPVVGETLEVGIEDWPPWLMTGNEGDGILVDILRLAAGRLGVELSLQDIPTVRRNQYEWGDTVFAEPGVIPEWRMEYEYTSVYTIPLVSSTQVVLMKKDRIRSAGTPESLYGLSLGANRGYYYTDGFNDAFEAGLIQRVDAPSSESLFLMLLHDRIDAVIIDDIVARYLMKKNGVEPILFERVYEFIDKTPLSIRLHVDKQYLIDPLNREFQQLEVTGTIDEIVNKYTE